MEFFAAYLRIRPHGHISNQATHDDDKDISLRLKVKTQLRYKQELDTVPHTSDHRTGAGGAGLPAS